MGAYPTFEEIIERPDHERLLEVRRSFRSVVSHFTLFFVSSVIVYALNVSFHDWRVPEMIPLLGGLSIRWLALVPAVTLLEILRKYHDDIYVFGGHHVNHYEGRLSLSSTFPSVKYVDILAVRVKQDIWGRLLNYGNVELDTAASADVELTLTGILSPSEVAEIVDSFRRRSTAHGSVHTEPTEPAKPAVESNSEQQSVPEESEPV